MRKHQKRSLKVEKKEEESLDSRLNVVHLNDRKEFCGAKIIAHNHNQLWDWRTLEEVVFK